ncbi:MAG: hypothetical protein ACOCV7_05035 [Desulfonatronovibrionaceae bacterium]
MNFLVWTALLLILSFWVLGYYYVKMYGDVSAREHKVTMAKSRMRHQMAGLESQKKKLDESIEKINQELEQYRKT